MSDNKTISLSKSQTITLTKSNGEKLSNIFMGLSWTSISAAHRKATQSQHKRGFFASLFGAATEAVSHVSSGGEIDLDSSVICFDKNGEKVDASWFSKLDIFGGAIHHNGDNRVGGEGEGADDERIDLKLDRIPKNVESMVFTVNSFTNQTFDDVEKASCRLVDADNNEERVFINLTATGKHRAVIMAKIYREGAGWKIQAISEIVKGEARTFNDMMPQIKNIL